MTVSEVLSNLFTLCMDGKINIPRQVERIATLAAKAAQIAATRVALTDCDEAILDVIEAASITQEAQELAKEVTKENDILHTVEEAQTIAQHAVLIAKFNITSRTN